MIGQGFGFTRDFLKERNNSAYCRLKKISCEFKEQARARHPGEKCGLALVDDLPINQGIVYLALQIPAFKSGIFTL